MKSVVTKTKRSKPTIHAVPSAPPPAVTDAIRDAENLALGERGGHLIYGAEADCGLADVIATALGVYTDEPFEHVVLRAISNELHVLHDGLVGGELESDSCTFRDYIYQLAERARAACELGRRFELARTEKVVTS